MSSNVPQPLRPELGYTVLGLAAGAAEHSSMVEPLTVAFMNIGLTESAFEGSNKDKHCAKIRLQVDGLRVKHNVTMYCFVEAGIPRVGLSDKSKELFMQAVKAGASEHGSTQVRFIWAMNESLVVAFPALLHECHLAHSSLCVATSYPAGGYLYDH